MKRFLKHFFFLIFFIPVVAILLLLTRCAFTAEIEEQYGIVTKVTVTEADGTVFTEEYTYNHGYTAVTIGYYENDALVRTEERELAEDDPLLRDTFEVLPHPTATAAKIERTGDGSKVTLRYFDSDGSPEGHSELVYNTWDRLAKQVDYDANGNLLRTTTREFVGHTHYVSNLSGEDPAE